MGDKTGKRRYRVNWRGKLILQVEEIRSGFGNQMLETFEYAQWRDARVEDLTDGK